MLRLSQVSLSSPCCPRSRAGQVWAGLARNCRGSPSPCRMTFDLCIALKLDRTLLMKTGKGMRILNLL